MSIKQFTFKSPKILINEIDNSQLPREAGRVGPVIIGRMQRGPAMHPVKVESFSDFVEIFGNPEPGGQGGDVWRDGNHQAPLYGAYAAQAWLRNNTPATVVRLLGYGHTDATTAGVAGWETKDASGNFNGVGPLDVDGGAYGLFLINSSSNMAVCDADNIPPNKQDTTPMTGTLAAIWYLDEGSIVLTGTFADGVATTGSTSALLKSIGSDKEFRAQIYDRDSNLVKTTTFNFNKNSAKYIRKVFNTNPTLTNSSVSQGANTSSYWLGQTYEHEVDKWVTNSTAGSVFGAILAIKGNAATKEGSDFRMSAQAAQTGWFFSQDLSPVGGAANSYQPENMTKLFKLHCLDTGEWTQSNIKVSIQDIKPSTNPFDNFGVFSVVLRKADDSDAAPQVVERFSSCNLNPGSPNYVAKKIGDKYRTWDDTERRYLEFGNYDNNSKFVRIEMNTDVEAGAINSELLPFGVYGPVRPKGFALVSGSVAIQTFGRSLAAGSTYSTPMVLGGAANIVRSAGVANVTYLNTMSASFTGSFVFPTMNLRTSSFEGNLANPRMAYWGLDTSITANSARFDPGYKDLVRPLPAGLDSFAANYAETEYAWMFSLDDLLATGSIHASHISGSRAMGTSITATGSTNYKAVLDLGFDRFTAPLFGGFDGLDITEKEPFNNTDLSGKTEFTSYAFNSVKRAIDSVSDPEVVEANLMVMPGITNTSLTDHLLSVCNDRADSLAIIDLEGGYIPSTENTLGDSSTTNRGDVDTTISNLKARGLNSSYGCAYYPWVQSVDTVGVGSTFWCPPSVVALGTMGSSEQKSELWFAPAGFTRGGLTEGSAGIPVIGVRQKLTSKERDKLYEANINAIASFPSEGIVIFGQKTLQVTPSALDRVNVRRLLIYIKKEIGGMCKTVLFDQNVQSTWNRLSGKVEPFLLSLQARLGLVDYKWVLDTATTTNDLIDRNVLYAKLFLKPAKSIEFILVDMSVSSSGAEFI